MTEINNAAMSSTRSSLEERIEAIDRSIDIMDRHANELSAAEAGVLEEMRRWDREFKDDRLHSTPRSMKHVR